jgi:trehalose synthase
VELVNDKGLRDEMGHKARETVRKNFLLTRYLEQHLDLFDAL